jgi:hypothetical protein
MAKHYLILEADSIDELMLKVNEHIDYQYEPLGGVVTDANYKFYQTMLKPITVNGLYALEEHKAHIALEKDLENED